MSSSATGPSFADAVRAATLATTNAAAQSFRADVASLGDIKSEDVRGYALIVMVKDGTFSAYNAAPGVHGERLIGRISLVEARLKNGLNQAEEQPHG